MDTSAPSQFNTTAWSVIRGAQGGGSVARECLERLVHTYWKPAYWYARRRGMDHHDASDCIQEFFARMLAGEWLASLDQDRGHFRGWLLTALRRWVSRSRTATGADRITLVSNDAVAAYEGEASNADPEDAFHRRWARDCMDEALRLLQTESAAAGGARARQAQVFTAHLEAAARDDGTELSYTDLAERFSVPVTSITNDLHRARALFKSYLLRVVRETVTDPREAEAELTELRRHLGGR